MRNILVFTVRFLQPYSHGRGERGDSEWPPSPLRLMQSLVAASAARWNERIQLAYAKPAMEWLEMQKSPVLVASTGVPSEVPTQYYVPDNTAELNVPAWKKGDFTKATKRTEKVVCPTHLLNDTLHYLYPLLHEDCPHVEVLKAAARSITHLGWGIDMVAADASVITEAEAEQLQGHRWRPVGSGGVPLRVPKQGTLEDLMRKHHDFLHRVSDEGFRPVPPLQCFDVVRYHSPTAEASTAPQLPMAAFEIHRTIDDQENNPSSTRFRAFHHVRRVAAVAGMVRHAVATVLEHRQGKEWVDQHIHGHGAEKQGQSVSDERLRILPLPSITPVGVNAIRRVLIVGWPDFDIAPLRRLLNGQDLIDCDTKEPVATLSALSTKDKLLQQNYLGRSQMWSTVTPVVLPGFDDCDKVFQKLKKGVAADEQHRLLNQVNTRILELIWKAFHNAGFTADALEGAQIEYRKIGWFERLGVASEYQLPPLHYPRYHVRICFARSISGPLCIGAGRYRGMGLFAAEN